MVFLIQNTQNRDAKAAQLKLDELILSMYGARNTLVKIEELSDEELEQIQKQFQRISEHYSKLTNSGEEIEAAKVNKVSEQAQD